jgi:hypothetical protein
VAGPAGAGPDPGLTRFSTYAKPDSSTSGFALGYAAVFALLGQATWWLGALLGLLHVAVAVTVILPLLPGVHPRMASTRAGHTTTAALKPPGLLGLNYGIQTPAVAVVAHVLYGTVLGLLLGAR